MPFALLLQENINVLSRGVKKIKNWPELIVVEELLLDRVRGAFIVNWFGTQLPVSGLSLKINIMNIDALRERYQAVREANNQFVSGREVNLTEPMAGVVGIMAGILFSPVGIFTGLVVLIRRTASLSGNLIRAISLTIAMLGSFLISGAALGAGGIGSVLSPVIALVAARDPAARAVYRILGSLALLFEALRGFLLQMFGSREEVRNPLLRTILGLADRLAVLFPHIFALFSFAVLWLGPILIPLSIQIPILFTLIKEIGEIIGMVFQNTFTKIACLYDDSPGACNGQRSPLSTMKYIFSVFNNFLALPVKAFNKMFKKISAIFEQWAEDAAALFNGWWETNLPKIEAGTVEHPVLATIQALTDAVAVSWRILFPASTNTTENESNSSSGSLLSGIQDYATQAFTPPTLSIQDTLKRAGQAPPPVDLNTIQTFSGYIGAIREIFPGLLADPFAISPSGQQNLDRLLRPRTVFAAERRALIDQQGRTPEEQLSLLRQQELPFRNYLFQIVERILPSVASSRVSEVRNVFTLIDENIYEYQEQELEDHPVRRLVDNRRIRPVVHRLRIRTIQAESEEERVNSWSNRLIESMNSQVYLAESA